MPAPSPLKGASPDAPLAFWPPTAPDASSIHAYDADRPAGYNHESAPATAMTHLAPSAADPPPRLTLFTGKERDTESGNDYFGARYFGSSMGRFLSPDPTGGNLLNPQTLNKYSYTLNNPLIYTDPTGLDCVHINNDTGAYEGFNSGDCDNSTEASANSGYYVDGTVNSVSFNSQNQVIGYGTTTGAEGDFDSFAGSTSPDAGPASFSLNPYSGSISTGDTVNVNGTSSAGPSTTPINITSLIPSGGLQPPSGMPEMRAGTSRIKLTPGEIARWCETATALSAGGTVPGAVPPSPVEDTPDQSMLVPSEKAQYPGETRPMETRSMTPNSGQGNNAANGAAMVGTFAECVSAVSAANH